MIPMYFLRRKFIIRHLILQLIQLDIARIKIIINVWFEFITQFFNSIS